jgi:hypothetical protein
MSSNPNPNPNSNFNQVEKIIGLVEPKAPAEGTAGSAPAPTLHAHSTPVQQETCAVQ